MAGEHGEAYATYQRAARRTARIPERRYLLTRARRIPPDTQGADTANDGLGGMSHSRR